MKIKPLNLRFRYSKNTWISMLIIILIGLSLWVLIPIDGTRFGREGMRLGLDLQGGVRLLYQADLEGHEDKAQAMDGAIGVIERRINVLGVSEPVINKMGDDQILIELPGVSETEKAKELIGLTALLEFREWEEQQEDWIPAAGVVDGEELVLTSQYFEEDTKIVIDTVNNKPLLLFSWDQVGAELSRQITGRLIGEQMAIFLGSEPLEGEDGRPIAPVVQSVIEEDGQIEGLSLNDARTLSSLLNAGRIPVELNLLYSKTVSATLGDEFVDRSVLAGIIGLALVMLFMILYYRLPGALASLSLVIYTAIVLAIFKLIPVTLSLAGIAGFVLSIGMAVDANVLIFERMKEELRSGRTLGASIETGFNRAWVAIRDSNISTFIICGILYWFGSSIVESPQVMGFAVTLFIGVAVSMFTAIVITRTFLRLFKGSWAQSRLRWFGAPKRTTYELMR